MNGIMILAGGRLSLPAEKINLPNVFPLRREEDLIALLQ
jgi:hypothetical protein